MKTKINKIKSNPYRNINKYPLDREKIDALKQSIEETGLWKNAFCVRENPNRKDEYQLVFGHHTLQAAKELRFKEINVTVEELSDEVMIKRMANENMDIWGPVTSTILETVGAIKEYIEDVIKNKEWEDLTSDKFIRCLFETKTAFTECRTKGIGRDVILKFLGKPWKQWQVQDALKILNDEKIKIEAVEKMNKLNEANEITKTFIDYDVDKEDQEDIVDEVKEEIEKVKKDNKKVNKKKRKEIAEKIIENKGYEKKNEKREYHKIKELNSEIIIRCNSSLQNVNTDIINVLEEWNYCDEKYKNIFKRKLQLFIDILKEHKEKVNWNKLIEDKR